MAAAYVRIKNNESASKSLFAVITRLDWRYAMIALHCLGFVNVSTAKFSSYTTSCESNSLFRIRTGVYFTTICKVAVIFLQN
jgi:hypothetical protein